RVDYEYYTSSIIGSIALDDSGNPGIVYYTIDEIGDFVWDGVESWWGGDGNVTTSLVYAKYSGSTWSSSTVYTFPLKFAPDGEAMFVVMGQSYYPYLITNTNTLDISQVEITQVDNKSMVDIEFWRAGVSLVYNTSTLDVGIAYMADDGSGTDQDLFFVTSSVLVAPSAPTGLTATPSTSTQIDVTWNSTGGATSYILYRSTDNFSTTSTVTTTALTSYSDTGLTASTQYYYKVAAINEIGTGNVSTAVNTTTLAGAVPYDGSLPLLPTNSKQKLVYANDIYYLTFTSSTSGLWDIYITTSTSGGAGTWSEPVVVSASNIKTDDNGPQSFEFVYNTTASSFALAYTSTSSITYFTTSTNAVSWSTPVSGQMLIGGYFNFDYIGNNVLFVGKSNTVGVHGALSSYSTNGGSTFVTSSVFTRDVSAADDPSSSMLGARIGGDGSLHMIYFSGGEDGTIIPHQLIYASSTDNGVSWTTTTIGTEIGTNSIGLELGTLSLNSNDDPGVIYLNVDAFDGSNVTYTARIAKQSALGVWSTSTINSSLTTNGISGFPKEPVLLFVGSDYPLTFYPGANYNPVWAVSTTTDPYVFSNTTVSSTVIGDNTSHGMVYVTSTEIVAMSYIDNAGQLYFVTSSLALPAGSAPTAPSGVTASGISTSSIEYFYWTDNSDDEDGFIIGTSEDSVNYDDPDPIEGLTPNTQYWFHVGAYNAYGTSTYAVTTTYTNPDVPGTPTISNVSTSSLTLTWNENLNASNTAYYILYSDGTTSTISSATTTSITGLTPNTEYTFAVRAEYLGSPGTYTAYSASSTETYTLASTPTAPTVTTTSATSLNVTVADDGATTYAVKVVTGATTKYLQADGTIGDSAVWFTYDKLYCFSRW
ncbi:MAG: Fibronectin type III domain protein, partial [Candidatus Magasanikbacteria bacterium GW2011_GWC2_34_16]